MYKELHPTVQFLQIQESIRQDIQNLNGSPAKTTILKFLCFWVCVREYSGISLVLAILHLTILTKVLLNWIFWPHE